MHIVNSYGADALRWDFSGGCSGGCVGSLLMADPYQEASWGVWQLAAGRKLILEASSPLWRK